MFKSLFEQAMRAVYHSFLNSQYLFLHYTWLMLNKCLLKECMHAGQKATTKLIQTFESFKFLVFK